MNKYLIPVLLIVLTVVFSYCNSSKKIVAERKFTYDSDVTNIITTNCSPCHIPSKGGNKKAYDNYANVKTDIDQIIRRIELNPVEKGFMPFKKSVKLSDSTINVFKKWRDDGLAEN